MPETQPKPTLPYDTVTQTWTPDGKELVLQRDRGWYFIFVDGTMLMSSRYHETEEALGRLGCAHITNAARASVLIGGLGMGFTLRAALDAVANTAEVTVAELVEGVIGWNHENGPLAELAGNPLSDPRTRIARGDVGELIRSAEEGVYDAILIDTDNEPQAFSYSENDSLYTEGGLAAAWRALRPNGILAFWFLRANEEFIDRLCQANFRVARHDIASGQGNKNHVVVVATRQLKPIQFLSSDGPGEKP